MLSSFSLTPFRQEKPPCSNAGRLFLFLSIVETYKKEV
nr:MAG TPA: hypothetical protein [Caudoviricetes sp.]